ncbi:MAG: aminotransferase class I/II-fold pyridoxal phosphate-dependent enzyme [Gammaproteobacteria bacterium]|nr:aminotransferase class I/II-fold pyridoxal phosphate-dependent enzyme [Gammaproteobacteria bacterium]
MPVTKRMKAVLQVHQRLMDFVTHSTYAKHRGDPDIFDFTFGNPQEMPIPGFTEVLQKWVPPQDKDWYAYKLSDPEACETVAASLSHWRGVSFDAQDIAMTNGAFGAIAIAFNVFLDPGDEVIFSLPPWFAYEPMLVQAGAVCVKVPALPDSFDLDVDAIAAAITPRTRMVIVNSPNNPTGVVYSPQTLERLAGVLSHASNEQGQPIYLLSDEPYARLVFGGKPFPSPAAYYPYSMIAYSYGKVLLTPGQRIGFLALPPQMPEREERRQQIVTAQIAGGWLFPSALLQHAIGDLDKLSIDLTELEFKRDLMVAGLRDAGYEVHPPDGTFYLLPKAPMEDDMAFAEILAAHNLFVMPGTICSIPGYFRITLTSSRERLQQSLGAFAAARASVSP